MKNEEVKRGTLSRIFEHFTRNWGLKLLALALALIIYHSLKTQGILIPIP